MGNWLKNLIVGTNTADINLLNNISDALIIFVPVFDKNRTVISCSFEYVNKAFEDFTGLKLENLKNQTVKAVWPDLSLQWTKAFHQVAQTGQSVNFQQLHDPTGKILKCKAFRPDESSKNIWVVLQDVTELQILQKSEAALNSAQRLSKVGGWEWDIQNQTMFWTAETYRIHDLTPSDFSGDTKEYIDKSIVCYNTEDHDKLMGAFHKCIDKGIPFDFEVPFTTHKGRLLWVRTTAEAIWEDGRIIKVAGNLMDITEHKKMELRLGKSEKRYRELFSAMNEGFAIHEMIFNDDGKPIDYRFLALNPAFEKLTGLKSSECVGKTVLEILPGTEQNWIETFGKVVLTGEPVELEDYSQELERYYHVIAFRNASGQFACMVEDVTKRKKNEMELERLKSAVDQTGEIVIITDSEGKIQYVNPAFEKTSGYKSHEVIGKTPRILNSGLQGEDFEAELWKTIKSGQTWSGRFENQRKDGTLYTEEATISPIRDNKGNIINYVAVKTDITNKLALENQLRQSQKMEAFGQLAGGIAHDFNNMLHAILGYTEILLMDFEDTSDQHQHLTKIQQAAQRSSNLTKQLLAFARKQTISPKIIDVNDTVESILRMLKRLIGEDIDLDWIPGEKILPIEIDPTQIDQILTNLIVNARDAIQGVGKIIIETHNQEIDSAYCAQNAQAIPGQYVMLSISDNGIGMDNETKQNIFEPFFTTKSPQEGTGLGLATVYGILQQNRGFANVYSEPEHGTTFKLYIPAKQGDININTAAAGTEILKTGNQTILLVDDEPALLEITKDFLQSLGYSVIATEDPNRAVEIFKNEKDKIHLLLTDMIMPNMSGRELAIKLTEIKPDLRSLFMSGYTENVISSRGVVMDGINFIQKPFSRALLADNVHETLK